ncbi:DNA-directed DNA polymerase alpha subunit pol12 [Friedmanniomyces endolithicus]|uniref:DNA polymerase alpha subunit B n=1 Tax=Friedmanniomyces endolithicus TaxID=329885 RepID=A0AAN6KMG9_9PEZI|nr:DNA-directed DNA polymerase alpha subunit pol12 [Friedmanniomyces endolithicus]KAK0961834.1 DNA-directed DNA polymerase alpha subunit pol12 [Friedmanniomyces endolithicus]KAK0992155.1 DNA-directed DNA polymerase alpha subunit pol12 [Friedmanniomyces endolithicus]KAK1027859.1 DNA-directed DNA polymerase alpha subunit pol12 [Friedmanniomyces endolithicus]
MSDSDKLADLFAPSAGGSLSDDVANELHHILRLLDLSAQELFFKWESYVIKMGVENTTLDSKTARAFKKDLQDALERESRAKGHVVHQSAAKRTTATPRGGGGGDVFGMLDGMVSATPAPRVSAAAKRKANNFDTPASKSAKSGLNSSPADSKTPIPAGETQGVAFDSRQNAGEVVQQINDHIPAASAPAEPPTEARAKLKANLELPKFAYKTMAMKLSETSEILDDRIDTFTDLIQAHYQLPDSAFGNPAAQSTAEVVAVGRIACDQPNGKLNAASVVLETSRRMGAGLRVQLKFDGVGYDLFPGKIVAVRGTNVSGEYFVVTEVMPIPPMPLPASTPAELEIHNDRLTGPDGEATPLGILVASGPHTTDADLSFAALHALLAQAEDQRTDVLILAGPFLDLEHPVVASGDFHDHLPSDAKLGPDRATLNDVFRLLVSGPLQRLVQAVPTITIIIVPSLRDAISKHVAWPQDRFAKAPLGLPKQVQVVTNPILLSINEMIFGISTQDVLSELRRENVHQSSKGQALSDDTLARLTSNVIEQRHFFPVFPPQSREDLSKPAAISGDVMEAGAERRLAVGASLDIAYLKLAEWINVRPDVLILPSVLNPFVKVVEGMTCINPGTLCKKRSPGHFAAMNVLPRVLTDEERDAGEAVAHNVFERARVDIVRI